MGKLKRKSSGYSPISRKVLSGLRKTNNMKVIEISELKNAKIHAENLEKSVITEKELSELDHYMVFMLMAKTKFQFLLNRLPS